MVRYVPELRSWGHETLSNSPLISLRWLSNSTSTCQDHGIRVVIHDTTVEIVQVLVRWRHRSHGEFIQSFTEFCPERIQFGQGSLCWILENTSRFHSVSYQWNYLTININVLLQLFFGSHVRWSSTGFLPHFQPSIFIVGKKSLDALIFWECHTSCILKMHFPFSTTLVVLSVHHVPLKIRSTFVCSDTYRSCSMGFFYSSSTQVGHRYHMTGLKNRPEGGRSILAHL